MGDRIVTASRHLVLPATSGPTVQDLVSLAERAESRGYDRIWRGEGWGRDAVTVLATVADRTDQLGLGTSILSVYSRSPALSGQTAATLQEASDGRFRLGIGPSGPGLVERWHGTEFERPLRRTREYIQIVRAVLSGSVVTFDGDIFDLDGFRLRQDPPSPAPEVDVAAMGPKAVELAGRFADGWHPYLYGPSGLEDRIEDLERGASMAGRTIDDCAITAAVPTCVLSDGDRARRLVATTLAHYVGGMGSFYRECITIQGFEAAATSIRAAWEDGDRGRAIDVADDVLVDELAIAGTPPQVEERLRAFEQSPADAVSFQFPDGADLGEIQDTVDFLAPS